MPLPHPTPRLARGRQALLLITLVLMACLLGTMDSQAHQLLSADGTHISTPAPATASDDTGISADDDVVLVVGYAAVVVLALGGLALLDRKPPHDDHDDHPDHQQFD